MNGEIIYHPRCVNRLITKQEGRQTIRKKSCSFHWHLTLGRSGTGAHKIAIRNCCCSRDSCIQGCLRFRICAAAGIAFNWGRGDLTGVRWACTRRLHTACHRGHVAGSCRGGRCGGLRTTALEEGTDRQIESDKCQGHERLDHGALEHCERTRESTCESTWSWKSGQLWKLRVATVKVTLGTHSIGSRSNAKAPKELHWLANLRSHNCLKSYCCMTGCSHEPTSNHLVFADACVGGRHWVPMPRLMNRI